MAKYICKLFGHKPHNDSLLIALSGKNSCVRCNEVCEHNHIPAADRPEGV
jgi:hypothetical protein